jgi:hypothetical protein
MLGKSMGQKAKKKKMTTEKYIVMRPKRLSLTQKIVRILLGVGLLIAAVFLFVQPVKADEIVHKFKNPSFSGIGQGAHYLTICFFLACSWFSIVK